MEEGYQQTKGGLHQRNKHKFAYNFTELCVAVPELNGLLIKNLQGDTTLDFADPKSVRFLNKALLLTSYNVDYWDIPKGFLCPAIPGRVDYIHYLADLVDFENHKDIKVLDIGVGANCIYPLVGFKEYGWKFVASEVDKEAFKAAKLNVSKNNLDNVIELRFQESPLDIFTNLIKPEDSFDITMCNPPFYASADEALLQQKRKIRNLGLSSSSVTNFGGKANELWCKGGEEAFLRHMIKQSVAYGKQVTWFTSLISKKENLNGVYRNLRKYEAKDVKTIIMEQGNKRSRVVAWTFKNL